MDQERTITEVVYGPQPTAGAPASKPEAGKSEVTAAELLYGKNEPVKESPKADPADSKTGEGKNYLDKLAEDAAKADRYDLKLPEGAAIVDTL